MRWPWGSGEYQGRVNADVLALRVRQIGGRRKGNSIFLGVRGIKGMRGMAGPQGNDEPRRISLNPPLPLRPCRVSWRVVGGVRLGASVIPIGAFGGGWFWPNPTHLGGAGG